MSSESNSNEYEFDAGPLDSFKPGSMQEVVVNSSISVLVSRTSGGDLFVTSHKCTHYGAKLGTGAMCGSRVVCPWHNAAFNLETGDIEDGPALSSLAKYAARVADGRVLVTIPACSVPAFAGVEDNGQRLVLVGGGCSSLVCAESARQAGFTGEIVMLAAENYAPYGRLNLSKNVSGAATPEKMIMRKPEQLEALGIQVRTGHRATRVDPAAKTVHFSTQDGSDGSISYTDLFIATGVSPRKLSGTPGADLDGIYYIREMDDVAPLAARMDSDAGVSKVVIVGSGFIGMETACWFTKKEVPEITVVSRSGAPMARVFGNEIGQMAQQLHEEKGAKFVIGAVVDRFEAADAGSQTVSRVVLSNGDTLEADVVVVGAGSVLESTGFLEGSGIERDARGAITVDKFLRSMSCENVYAGGDIASFPYHGQQVRIEHWNVAQNHGRAVGRTIGTGQATEFVATPFFWTMQYGSLRYVGHSTKFDEIVFQQGTPSDRKFVAFYIEGDRVAAVCSYGCDPAAAAAGELFRTGAMPTAAQVKAGPVDLVSLLN